jgi:capsular polysaccharide biosynthesis protein
MGPIIMGRLTNMPGSDAITVLRWGLRRYAWLFALYFGVVAVLIPAAVQRSPATYDSAALIIAQRLDMDLVALPRYGQAVFDNGEVARVVASHFGHTTDFEDIVPERVSVVAEQDSIVLRVVGHDRSPATAAELANVAAETFVGQLNKPGEGVGAFTVQSAAVPPSEPVDPRPSLPLLLPVSLLAALALALAVVALILVVRRPILEPADAEAAVGVPVIGTVTVPRRRAGDDVRPEDVLGVAPLCRRIMAGPADRLVLLSAPRTARMRHDLTLAIASTIARVRPVEVDGPPDVTDTAQRITGPATANRRVRPPGKNTPLTIVDASNPVELVGAGKRTTVILLVRQGIAERALRAIVAGYLDGDSHLLLVRRGRRAHRSLPQVLRVSPTVRPASKAAEEAVAEPSPPETDDEWFTAREPSSAPQR